MAETQATPWIGTFIWNELGTRDLGTAKSLFMTLLGWKAEDMDMGPNGTYTIFKSGDKQVGGGWDMKGEKHQGLPTHWMGYVGVKNADATVESAKRLGIKIQVPPTDIPNVGRFAVLEHSATGTFAILEPKPM
jgi:predicted enzyme related to lactoylglutathione lyase